MRLSCCQSKETTDLIYINKQLHLIVVFKKDKTTDRFEIENIFK